MKSSLKKTNSILGQLKVKQIFVAFSAMILLVLASHNIFAQTACTQSQVVINEIYTEGGLTGATYKNDFVELFNTSATTCNLSNYSIQVANGNANNFPNVFAFPTGSVIPGRGYFLIQFASGGANGATLPQADFSATGTDLTSSGKVALVNQAASLTGNCTSNLTGSMDFVGYGSTNCYLGGGAAMLNTVTHSIQRTYDGADTRNNNVDFLQKPVSPRNTLSPTAAGVAVTGRVTIGGVGLYGARVMLTDQSGAAISVKTNNLGYYAFASVPSGATYVVNVSSKYYYFAPQVLQLFDQVTDLNFEYYSDAPTVKY